MGGLNRNGAREGRDVKISNEERIGKMACLILTRKNIQSTKKVREK